MSNSVSALQGVSNLGGIADVAEVGQRGMITLRGDFSNSKFKSALKKGLGCAIPEQRQVVTGKSGQVAWMSPDELLIMVSYPEAARIVAELQSALAGVHSLVVNVSDARAVFSVSGVEARDVMAKLAPVDFAKDAFQVGEFRRSRMAQVPAAMWLAGPDTFEIICFRSVAQYMFDLLSVAAQLGSEVDMHSA